MPTTSYLLLPETISLRLQKRRTILEHIIPIIRYHYYYYYYYYYYHQLVHDHIDDDDDWFEGEGPIHYYYHRLHWERRSGPKDSTPALVGKKKGKRGRRRWW